MRGSDYFEATVSPPSAAAAHHAALSTLTPIQSKHLRSGHQMYNADFCTLQYEIWSFSRKIPVVEQPKCGTKNIPRIFRRNQTSSGLPPVNSCFCSHPLSKSQFPAQEESDKQNIHLYFTFSYNSQQWSSQKPLCYFCLSEGLNMSNQSGLLCTTLPSQSILSHWTIEYIYVATCDSPYFQDLSLYTCSLKARIGFQPFRVGRDSIKALRFLAFHDIGNATDRSKV